MSKKGLKQYSFCLECGQSYYLVDYDAKFCGSCGKSLSTHCPNQKCGREIIVPDKHCVYCGYRMIKDTAKCTTFRADFV